MSQQENGVNLPERSRTNRIGASSRPNSMYPRFSQITDDYRSPPQSPHWSAATSFDATSELSIYQSALDLEDSKLSSLKLDSGDSVTLHLNKTKSGGVNMDEEPEVVMEMTSGVEGQPNTLRSPKGEVYFRDGVRIIDFVLAYRVGDLDDDRKFDLRSTFEENLKKEGLHLEYEFEEGRKVNFVKIHAPWDVLVTYAELMKFKMPMKKFECAPPVDDSAVCENPTDLAFELSLYPTLEEEEEEGGEGPTNSTSSTESKSIFKRCLRPFYFDPNKFPRRAKVLSKEFSKDKMFLFDIPENKDQFFSRSNRSRVVDFILKRKRFTSDPQSVFAFGITRLLTNEVYIAAFPLHERISEDSGDENDWSKLANEWASISKIFKLQPLDYIKDYFDVKIGLYFAWLGFYTFMLIPASVVGLVCFIFGIVTVFSDVPSNDICNKNLNITMCPSCDSCQYWRLDSSCRQTRFIHLVDNGAMVFFALFMSIWGAVFLELWKRYSARITYYWDLTGFDHAEEHPRPEYLARLSKPKKSTTTDPVTKSCNDDEMSQLNMSFEDLVYSNVEPYISFWKRKLPAIAASISVVFFMICLAVVAVVGVIFYRMSMNAALLLQYDDDQSFTSLSASVVTTATAALINLLCIMLLNQLYSRIANCLTEFEMPRTQTDYDESLTLKMFMFQFVNYYASIFYIAFFKGKLIGYPGKYERLLGFRQEECGPGGCLMELAIQLAIIMVGKQALNAMMEMFLPRIKQWYSSCGCKAENLNESDEKLLSSWERDFLLVDIGAQGLFSEYLEMVLQFGFVTLFVAAFPLAPLFALINNALEMRLDAQKFMFLFRRPVARRIQNIGVWYRIMDCIGKFAVITNAFIIAFTSTFIPRLVYKYKISPDQSLNGYLNYSLSVFDINDFESLVSPKTSALSQNISSCRYDDYRYGPSSDDKYEHTAYFWYLLVARLAFVVVFENVIMLVVTLLRWLVPDVPRKIQEKIRKDTYLMNEILVDYESAKRKLEVSKRQVHKKFGNGDGR